MIAPAALSGDVEIFLAKKARLSKLLRGILIKIQLIKEFAHFSCSEIALSVVYLTIQRDRLMAMLAKYKILL